MTRRAWWLIVPNIFVPGSAQVLAGSRALGRFAGGRPLQYPAPRRRRWRRPVGHAARQHVGRQRVLQEAILKQFHPANVLTKFQGVAEAGQQVVKTDVPQGTLGYFANLAGKTRDLPVGSVELVPDNGVDPQTRTTTTSAA
ncbi:hypothetical protein [Cryobacterium sp. Y29]|uniref:hypothetical protein n=1 Tax=Cryobacterium sp. Y29 TaxID=2048285 RepID=UPI0013048C2C|nr:hypothetical protein [Cryobacterium sp. Y29]